MGSFDKIEIGRRSLYAAQMGQRTTGQNIANVNTKGYTKQTLDQSDFYSEKAGIMNGVSVDGIKRSQDEFLERKILSVNSEFKNEHTRSKLLRNLEIIYGDREGRGLSNMIAEHWGDWDQLAVSPENLPLRQQLLDSAQTLTTKFNTLHRQTRALQKDITADIRNDINDINRWAEEIGHLNYKIVNLEARGKSANELKDSRDRMAGLLSDKLDVQRSYNKNGRLHLQIGNGHALVDGDSSYKLKFDHDPNDSKKVSVVLKLQDTSELDITAFTHQGETRERIRMVNEYIPDVLDKLDELADEIRYRVNKHYVTGTPLYTPFDKLESAAAIPPAYLNERISQMSPGDAVFKITDSDGDIMDTVRVAISANDTAHSIAEKINAKNEGNDINAPSDYLSARVSDAKFTLESHDGYQFFISEDTTGAMAKLGLNVFFSGHYGADDISVAEDLQKNSARISAGENMLPGNNKTALHIGDLRQSSIMNQGTETFDEYYDKFSTEMSLDLQSSKRSGEMKKETLDQYNVMREEISGISIDEEMANIVRYQRAYEASAKFGSVADEMLQTVINMK